MNTIQEYTTEINNLKNERIEQGKIINKYLLEIADLKNQVIYWQTRNEINKDKISRRNQQIKDLNKNLSLSELNLHNYRLSLEGERAKLTIINR